VLEVLLGPRNGASLRILSLVNQGLNTVQ
jgi:hypothetical protein